VPEAGRGAAALPGARFGAAGLVRYLTCPSAPSRPSLSNRCPLLTRSRSPSSTMEDVQF
jgi:hypothetical protein